MRNKEQKKVYDNKYYQEHKNEKRANDKIWTRANLKKRSLSYRQSKLQSKFGITLEEYQTMWDAQGGVCAICGRPETILDHRSKKIRWLAVDHNHETGEVRGLLCSNCNKAVGLLHEDIEVIKNVVKYLER